jgi:hypothetical protein
VELPYSGRAMNGVGAGRRWQLVDGDCHTACRRSSGAENAANDLRAGAVLVHGGHEVGQPVAEVVHLLVEALDVAASLLQQFRR